MKPFLKLGAALMALGAAACAHTDPQIVYQTTRVPVTADQSILRCGIPPRPPASETMTQEEYDRYVLILFALYNTCFESVEEFKNELDRIESQVTSGN